MWRRALQAALLSISVGALASEPAGVFLDVPFLRQPKNGCGAASVAMVMRYWRRQKGESETANVPEIQRTVYSPDAGGAYGSDLERYLREHGFRTFVLKGEWRDLRSHLEKGRPLIVALKVGRNDLHYAVVTGLDWRQDIVLTHDPARRQLLRQHRSDFEKEWNAAGAWTLLAVSE